MRTTRLLVALLLVLGGSCLVSAAHADGTARAPLSMTADRSFSVTALSPEQTKWYNRILSAMDASALLANDFFVSNDTYTLGRDGGNYVEALLMAFKGTGDRRFLDRVYDLTEMARPRLGDAWRDGTTDGFTDWQWLIDPTNATFYGKDTNWLDESITSGNVALWTYAFQQNASLDPKFASAAAFWRSWLETQFLAKWYQRAGGDPLVAWNTPFAAFYKPDVEPRSANWRLAYYLWKVTGNAFYKSRCDEIVTQLRGAQTLNPAHPGAYRWARQLDPTSVEWQTINYANYYVRVMVEMNQAGMPFYSSSAEMARFAATFRDVVYASGSLSTMANDVNGGGSTGYTLYAMNALAPWDATGTLMSLADRSVTPATSYATGGRSKAARNDVYLSGYALMSLATPASPTAVPGEVATRFTLEPVAPNPFSASAAIAFDLPRDAHVRLTVVDAAGRRVRSLEDATLPAGRHQRVWDGRDEQGDVQPAGIYFMTAEVGSDRLVRRAVRLP